MNQIVWYLFWEYAPIWLSQFWSFGIFWPQGPKVDQFNSLDYKQFRSKTMHLAPKYVPLWKFCEILVPRGLLKPKIGFNNHSPVQIWSLMKKSVFGRVNFLVSFSLDLTYHPGMPLHPRTNAGKKCSKPFWQAFTPPPPFRAMPKMETTHFKKGLPLVWHPMRQLL